MSLEELQSVFVCDNENEYDQDENQNRFLSIKKIKIIFTYLLLFPKYFSKESRIGYMIINFAIVFPHYQSSQKKCV